MLLMGVVCVTALAGHERVATAAAPSRA
jgi:hypothetical protein